MNFFETNSLLFSTLVILIAFTFSYIINLILLKFSQNLGARTNSLKEIRWNTNTRPSIGGISFYVIFLITFIFLNIINNIQPLHFSNLKLVGILMVCSLAFLMGLADDAYNTKPLLKFIVQLVCGLILYFTNTKITMFNNEALNFATTLFWVIGLMNSINMLDNMDAISTIVSIVILVFGITLTHLQQTSLVPLNILSLGLIGTLLGFLVYNWNPAKIFMGDTGSQFLGVFLAIIGIEYCFNAFTFIDEFRYNVNSINIGFTVVITVFIIPLTDTATVFINRISKGKSPLIGGKDHTTHHLFFKGITEKQIAILYFTIQFIAICLALNIIFNYTILNHILAFVFCILIFLGLYLNTIIKKK